MSAQNRFFRWSPGRVIALGMTAAVATRVIIAFAPGLPERGSFPDEGVVWQQARHLVEEGRYFCVEPSTPEVPRQAFRPPLLPFLAALGLLLFGSSGAQSFVLAVNALSGAALTFFAAKLARRLAARCALERGLPSAPWERRAVIVAALYGVFSPLPLVFARYTLTESLALALVMGASWLMYEALTAAAREVGVGSRGLRLGAWGLGAAIRHPHVRAVLAGVLLGLAALTRASLLGLPAAYLVIAIVWVGPRRAWRVALPLGAAFLVVLAPWTLRNALVLGAFVPVAAQGGEEFYEACGPGAGGGIRRDTLDWPSQLRGLDEVGRDRLLWHLTWEHIARDPGEFLRLIPIKLARTWWPWSNRGEYRHPLWSLALGLEWLITVIPAAATLWVLRRRGLARALLVLSPAWYLAAVHGVFLGSVRYRVVALGAFWPLCALAAALLWHTLRARRTPAPPTPQPRD